jgi:Putative zinc-finger
MTRHLSTEQLSSYMDGETGPSQAERIEEHLGSCPACRGRLESMERLVLSLHRIQRRALPLAVAAGVRRQIATAPEPSSLQRLWLLLSEMSLRPAFRTSAAMGLAMLFSVFLLSQSLIGSEEVEPKGIVKMYFGMPLVVPQTTSEVAGLEFVMSDTDEHRWIQRGLEGEVPESLVAAKSPEGRAMLTRYSDLEILLDEGRQTVVMRYRFAKDRFATVELSGS